MKQGTNMYPKANALYMVNTFGLDVSANQIIYADKIEKLCHAWQTSQQLNLPFLLLGEGSNVLLLEDFAGVVALNRLQGIVVEQDFESWHIHCAAGENWHQFVTYLTDRGIGGLENLALIPGLVGAAPVQNIGAYGVELKDVCEYVDILDLERAEVLRLTTDQCQFGYRDSLFKHQYQHGFAIVAVGFCLDKNWRPITRYGELRKFDAVEATPKKIYDEICRLRMTKLPDPKVLGNAGSFFKNPVVSGDIAKTLLDKYPDAPHYLLSDGDIKFAAGWLVEQAELKGERVGGAAVHQQQALVLINIGNASANDFIILATKIRNRVFEKFSIWLEPEVRFISATGEVDASSVIS